jgi:hypothetical protein
MPTYLDSNGYPAIRLAFGYSLETDETTSVLAVRAGRVVAHRMTSAQFEAEYVETNVPFSVAIRALESIARTLGRDLAAHQIILFYLNAPAWKLRLVDYQLRLSSLLTKCTQAVVGRF